MNRTFNAPKIIYLFDMGNGEIVWCVDATPERGMDEKDAVRYVRDDRGRRKSNTRPGGADE